MDKDFLPMISGKPRKDTGGRDKDILYDKFNIIILELTLYPSLIGRRNQYF